MTGPAELTLTVDVNAPAEVVWETVTDWPGQGEWMFATAVETTSGGDGRALGATLSATTGFGPLGVTDTMEVVEWQPPASGGKGRCVVRHTGAVIRGDGIFEVTPLGPARARFLWSELLDLPLGALGRLGWPLVRPAMRVGVLRSLHTMARLCEQKYAAGA